MIKFSSLSSLKRNRKGFTIIELMVVVLIIALLVAIAAPLYADVRLQTRKTAHDANVRTLKSAATLFVMANPSASAIWAPFANQKASEVAGSLATHDRWGRYVEVWPENPMVVGGTYVVEIDGGSGAVTVSPGAGAYESE